jgi:cytochrome c peroxidase
VFRRRPNLKAIFGGLVLSAVMQLAHAGDAYQWNLPKGFPKPYVPADNPMSAAKVELGRYLFYDTRLSVNGKTSCATCHKQELAFTDGRAVGLGTTGEAHSRGAMSLVNVAWSGALTWSNPTMRSLEKQALVPMYGEHPVELGLRDGDRLLPTLRADAKYLALFAQAFPDEAAADRVTVANVTKAIASFERSIVSARSPFDRYHYDRDDSAVSESAKRGEILFFSQHMACFQCHGGFNFTDSTVSERNPDREIGFHNNGLYATYAEPNVGIFEFTKVPEDRGRFKAPTLRNIAVTAPYMHDGSIATLEGVLDQYAAGGLHGHDNPNKDPQIGGFKLSAQDRVDFIAFLNSLTDEALLHDPRFSNPWPH